VPPALRFLSILVGLVLLAAGGGLAYLAAVALRRSEGVFMPAGYAAAICLVAGGMLLRVALRG
jgi:hypothetical protein